MDSFQMGELNRVFLIGRLTRDPELKSTSNGIPVCNFPIVVNYRAQNSSGEWRNELTHINIVTWQRLAELCGEYIRKGSSVLIEGRIQSRSWETESGEQWTQIDVRADRVEFLEKISRTP